MKRLIAAALAVMLLLLGVSACAEESAPAGFTPVLPAKYGFTADEWLSTEENRAVFCVAAVVELMARLEDFNGFGFIGRYSAYVMKGDPADAVLLLMTDGAEAVTLVYVPELNSVSYSRIPLDGIAEEHVPAVLKMGADKMCETNFEVPVSAMLAAVPSVSAD